jgi:hypothetical protein
MDISSLIALFGEQAGTALTLTEVGTLALAVDRLSGEVLLTWRLPLAGAEVSVLRDAVQSMVSTAASWRDRLAAPADAAGDVPDALSPQSFISPMSSFDFRA